MQDNFSRKLPTIAKATLAIFLLFTIIYFNIYNSLYNNYNELYIGESSYLVIKKMGKPDIIYLADSSDTNNKTIVYQYNMIFIAPDDIRLFILNGVIVGKSYDN